ncbi:unnamed protein product [Pedinophyceae sp. YPF-701]|nr:unnamed protein product [Pedinophyceae sp. YPF-701]
MQGPGVSFLRRFTATPAVSQEVAELSCTINVEGDVHSFTVPEGARILPTALSLGVPVPHDCTDGNCLTCLCRVVTGSVDCQGGVLDDDALERGYTLLCQSVLESDVELDHVSKAELYSDMAEQAADLDELDFDFGGGDEDGDEDGDAAEEDGKP